MSIITSRLQVAHDALFNQLILDENIENSVKRIFGKDELPYGQVLYTRVKHSSDETGESEWSKFSSFQIAWPAQIIGIMLDNSGTKGEWYWIDQKGNKLNNFDWTQHNVFLGISNVVLDNSRAPVTMTKIPKFYIKTMPSGPANSDSSGKKCWWISDIEMPGFRVHPAFKRNAGSQVSDWLYIGRYLGHVESINGTTVIGSKQGTIVSTGQEKITYLTYITNRNTGSTSESGYRMYDIWDHGLLRLLSLIMKRTPDTQITFGDNEANATFPPTGSTNARMIFKGTQANPECSIDDLWRNYWYYCNCISISDLGTVTVTDPRDQLTTLKYGSNNSVRFTIPVVEGWIKNILDCPIDIGGVTHDLMELFLPAEVISQEAQSTFCDYSFFNGGPVLFGSSASFIERYIEHGTRNISYYDQYGTSCSRRTYVAATSTSYYAQFGTSCSKRSYIASKPPVTYFDQYGTSCSKRVYHAAQPAYRYWDLYQRRCGGNYGQIGCNWGCGLCANAYCCKYATSAVVEHYSCGSTSTVCSSTECTYIYQDAQPAYYKCTQSSTTCAGASCSYIYSSTAAYYKCSQSEEACATSACPYTYVVEPTQTEKSRTQMYNSGAHGLFTQAVGLKDPTYNTGIIGCRIAKN